MLLLRTNNDLEGGQNFWKQIGKKANFPFYRLCEVHLEISKEVPFIATMLCYDKITRQVKKRTHIKNAILFRIWEKYQDKQMDSLQLLEEIVSNLKTKFPNNIEPLRTLPLDPDEIDEYNCLSELYLVPFCFLSVILYIYAQSLQSWQS